MLLSIVTLKCWPDVEGAWNLCLSYQLNLQSIRKRREKTHEGSLYSKDRLLIREVQIEENESGVAAK